MPKNAVFCGDFQLFERGPAQLSDGNPTFDARLALTTTRTKRHAFIVNDVPPPIETLLLRAKEGDAQALAHALHGCAASVRARLSGNIPSRWAAQIGIDDLLQQTYLDAFLSIGRFDGDTAEAFAGWLCAIARRNLQDTARALEADKRGGSRRPISLDASTDRLEPLLDEICAVSLTPSRYAARNEAIVRLRAAVSALPTPHRDVINGYDLEGRTMAEVAATIGRTVGTAYMLRARAMGWLAEMLGGTSFSLRPAG